jgi:hypothetical protein
MAFFVMRYHIHNHKPRGYFDGRELLVAIGSLCRTGIAATTLTIEDASEPNESCKNGFVKELRGWPGHNPAFLAWHGKIYAIAKGPCKRLLPLFLNIKR